MVRRRTRATKAIVSVSGEGGVNVALLTKSLGGGAASVVAANGNVLEDQYFASPKRKDCKIDCGVGERDDGRSDDCESFDPLKFVREVKEEIIEETNITRKSPSPGKSRGERGGISGRTIGVPLATRSQTRTIENYFKAKTAAKQLEKLQAETVEEKQEDTENNIEKTLADNQIQCKAINNDVEVLGDNNHDLVNRHLENHQTPLQIQCIQNAASNQHQELLQADFIFDLSEDTTDTDNTELSDEYSTASGGGGVSSSAQQPAHGISNFELHRSPIRGDSNSSRSSTTDNIFLQEPVLTLNVDKSPNQASSIKINKTLEIEPIFSSPPNITASALNGRFNKIVSLQCSPLKLRDSFGYEIQPALAITSSNCYALNLEHDNSSCDSGVAFATTTLDPFSPQQTQQNGGVVCASSSARRRKPATPHRIVCPSPIKAPPRIVSPANNNIGGAACGAAGRKIAGSKSQRHMGGNTGSKTRRRLNQPKDVAIPHRTTEQNGCEKQNGYEDEEPCHHIKQQQDYETILMPAEKASIAAQAEFHDAAVNYKTTQEKRQDIHDQKNQKLTNGKVTTTKTTHQQPKMKLYQPPHTQPLAATNGNRELTTFFQVRRSERKTKTAVKEEMMRNLEQAILEERADGLKIAHFENKGRGIVSERRFQRGEFVVEYIGDLISMTEAAEREKQYALDENAGCYMYYFKHKNQQYCIDATIDTGKLGRLVNHSRNGNLITKVVVVKQRPHLILIAKDDIEAGEELTYDYGDRSKESLLHHPWLAF